MTAFARWTVTSVTRLVLLWKRKQRRKMMAEKEYIEREAVKKLICGFCADCDGDTDVCEYRDIQVDAIPAADVRPVVKANWKHRKDSAWCGGGCTECSACGFGYSDEYYHEVEEFNFCPHCGAKMEES